MNPLQNTEEPFQIYEGMLELKTLYKRSKSENLYPVLSCSDGHSYRIHIKGNKLSSEPISRSYIDQWVKITGHSDKIRGHLRIQIENDSDDYIRICERPDPALSLLDKGAEGEKTDLAGPLDDA